MTFLKCLVIMIDGRNIVHSVIVYLRININLRYLECNGLIEVGKYEVLLETKLTNEPVINMA